MGRCDADYVIYNVEIILFFPDPTIVYLCFDNFEIMYKINLIIKI